MLTEELMKEVRRLQIATRRRVDDLFAGEYHSAFKGQGVEFAEVREYEPGDDIRAIDWNVTARVGRPFIKRFVEERQLTVILAVDLSSSGAFGAKGKLKSRIAVELSAVLTMVASRNSDRVGLLIFTDHNELYVPPRKGRTHILRLLRELLNFEPQGTGTDIGGAVSHLVRMQRRRAIIFLVSDFLAPIEGDNGFAQPLRLLSARHEVIAVTVADPRERDLPSLGLVETVDPETGRVSLLDSSSRRVRRDFALAAERHDKALDLVFRPAGVDRVRISTDRPFIRDLARYFQLRERRR